tara:strand:- start:56 stop:265 length:210 start_codon:yes stop_codon:yes gene_type:complete
MDRGSCVRCEENDGVIVENKTDLYCATCWNIEYMECAHCNDVLGTHNLILMKKNNYTDETGYYCERCIA